MRSRNDLWFVPTMSRVNRKIPIRKKSQFFDRRSRREPKNRNFLTEWAVGSRKIAIFWQKQPSGAEKSQFFDGISRQEQKNRNFLTETAVRSKKSWFFIENRKKPPIARERNTKSPVFYSSLASETQNRPFSTLRSQAKRRIARFLLFARKRNAESPVFYSSLVSETQNHPFSTLRS